MRTKSVVVSCLAVLLPLGAASANTFSDLYVFGDSLSDTGNAFLFSKGLVPGTNYGAYTFRDGLTTQLFTDGLNTSPVAAGPQGLWVNQLAGKLGLADPAPFLNSLSPFTNPGGTDYAFAGARSGSGPGELGSQIGYFASGHTGGASSTALYAIWAGADDILAGADAAGAATAADNAAKAIQALYALGARQFLWLDVPLIGDTPRGLAGDSAGLNAISLAYNTEWFKDLLFLQSAGIDVTGLDAGGLFAKILANPGAYGFTDVTDQANTSGKATDAGYLFWDDVHPTTTGHELVADAALAALVPEPATAGIAFAGILAIAGFAWKKRSRVQ